jgi:hypothetical protein
MWDGQRFQHFDGDGRDLIQYLKTRHAVVYAHNGGKFDFVFVADQLEPWTQIRMINNRMGAFKIGGSIYRDSYLILPTRLSSYKKDDFDYTLMEKGVRDRPEVRRQILEYLKNDCIYLHELVSKFRSTYGSQLTLASSGMKFFRE